MLALVSRPPVNAPSARPPRSKSLISSPCSRTICPTRPSPGSSRWRRVKSMRNSREADTAPNAPVPPYVTSKRADPRCRKVSRSSSGRPSSSQITRKGTGKAKASTRSTSPPGRGHLVELAVDDGLDPGTQPFQPAHRELRGEQLAEPAVLGRVGEAEPADVTAGRVAAAADVRPDVVAVRRGVREHLADLGLAGDDPDVEAEEAVSLETGSASRSCAEPGHRVVPVADQRPGQPVGDLVDLGQVQAAGAPEQPLPDRGLDAGGEAAHGSPASTDPACCGDSPHHRNSGPPGRPHRRRTRSRRLTPEPGRAVTSCVKT